jgi:Tfp pilus assembly protein PilO
MMTSTRKIVAIAAAGAVALVLIWYVALMRPQVHNLAAAHKAHAAAEQKIETLDSQLAGLRALVKQIPADRARLSQYTAAVPDTPSLDTALNQLQQAAADAGVTLSSVGPSAPASTSGGASSSTQSAPSGPAITLGITATGSYQALTNFLRQIASIPRALTVDSLSVASGGSGSQLSANISARIFYTGAPTP